MNIAISGWNGAGSSTLCLILAKNLESKLLQGSQTFRYIAKQLSYNDTGIDRIKADEYLEDFWGALYDKYVDYVLLHKDKYLVESDIAAFRIGKNPRVFSVFLIADKKARSERLHVDSRSDDVDVLAERDNSLSDKYKQLHNIDWLNTKEIIEKYNLVLDNTSLSIAEELVAIYEDLKQNQIISEGVSKRLCDDAVKDESDYWNNGKEWYINYLKEKNLLIQGEEIIRNVKEVFPDEVNTLPEELRKIINQV